MPSMHVGDKRVKGVDWREDNGEGEE